MIFGMYHYLVDIYQVCSKFAPGAKSGLGPRCHQGHGQLSTDTYMLALNRTRGSAVAQW